MATSGQQAWPSTSSQQTSPSSSGQLVSSSASAQPASSSTPSSATATGQTTLDDKSGSLVGIVALKGLGAVAGKIGAAVGAVLGADGSILIVEDRAFALSDAPHAEITARFEVFGQRLDDAQEILAPPPPSEGQETITPLVAGVLTAIPAVTTAATSIVGLATNVIGMFKSDYSVQNRDVSLDYAALAAAVAQILKHDGITIVVDGFLGLQGSPTFVRLNELLETRAQLEAVVQRRQATELDARSAEIDALNTRIMAATGAHDKARQAGKDDDAGHAQALINELRAELAIKESADFLGLKAQVAAANALIAAFDHYVTAMSIVPSGQQYSPIVAAALRDVVHAGVGGDGQPLGHVLYLEVTGADGDMIVRSGLFTSNRKVGLVGAVQATYLLVEPNGKVRASGSLGEYSAATFDVVSNELKWRQ